MFLKSNEMYIDVLIVEFIAKMLLKAAKFTYKWIEVGSASYLKYRKLENGTLLVFINE